MKSCQYQVITEFFCCFGQNIQKIDRITGSNPVLIPQVFRCFRTFITAAKTGFTICRFQKESKILPVLALGKGANTLILSSLLRPTCFSPTSGWTQSSDKPSTRAARAPCGSFLVRKLCWSHISVKAHSNWAFLSAIPISAILCWEMTDRAGGGGERRQRFV